MSLWVDKYRPKSLAKLDYHPELSLKLQKLVGTSPQASSSDFPHLIIHGPSGAGKKTRIMCLLRHLYGNGIDRLKIDHRSFQTPSGKKLDMNCLSSNYHIEVNPSDVGIYDRVVVTDLIKETAQSGQISKTQKSFKTIVLTSADKLTRDAQNGLRRTMEKYATNCRIIMVANSISKISAPLRSRCLVIRVPAPFIETIAGIVQKTSAKANVPFPPELAQRIAEKCDRNLRRALLLAEVCRVETTTPSAEHPVPEWDWQTVIRETASEIIQNQTPQAVAEKIRPRLYELLVHCIPPTIIFRGLLQELVSSCDATLKLEATQIAAKYEAQMQLGAKAIFHLEAFVIKFMVLYQKFMKNVVTQMDFD